jgi:hypothetical protein
MGKAPKKGIIFQKQKSRDGVPHKVALRKVTLSTLHKSAKPTL